VTTYSYPDAYLGKFCTSERETRALAIVQDSATTAGVTLSADWLERVTVAQTYVLAALENQADPEDLFAAKLKAYRQQLDALMPQAIAAARRTAGTISNIGLMSVPLERA
jgi:hypothetical protein